MALADDPPEMKFALWFEESEKPMTLNTTNATLIASITGQEDTDNWIGHQVELYNDPSIMFRGKVCGGIRVRAVRGGQPQRPAARPAPTHGPMGKPVSRPAPASAPDEEPNPFD